MRTFCLIFSLIFGFLISECFGQYPSNYIDAQRQIQQQHKYGLIFLTASWCQPCQKFEHETLAKYYYILNQFYVFYVVDIDKEPEVQKAYLRANNGKLWNGSVPAYFLLSKDLKYTLVVGYGYKSPQDFAKWYNTYVVSAVKQYEEWLNKQNPLRPYQTPPSGG